MAKFIIPEPNQPQKKPRQIKNITNKFDHRIEGHVLNRKLQRRIKKTWIVAAIENGRMKKCDPKGKKVVELRVKEIRSIIKSIQDEIERLTLRLEDNSIKIKELEDKINDLKELIELEGIIVAYNMITRKIVTAWTFKDPWKVQNRIIHKKIKRR